MPTKKPPSTPPILNHIRIRLTEEMETNVEVLFAAIVGEMADKKVDGLTRKKFVSAYFNTRDQGRDALMALFRTWVVLWPKEVR